LWESRFRHDVCGGRLTERVDRVEHLRSFGVGFLLECVAAGFVSLLGQRDHELLGCRGVAGDSVEDSDSVSGEHVAAGPFENDYLANFPFNLVALAVFQSEGRRLDAVRDIEDER
jgi:hypothetical protein